ncbi:MAG: limonene-1,2-epoxide hydrolase family protein [Acidimicrobiales bacterium]
MPAAQGLDAIRSLVSMIVGPSESIEFDILRIASVGVDVVFTERIDRLLMGGRMIELPVAGVFEVTGTRLANAHTSAAMIAPTHDARAPVSTRATQPVTAAVAKSVERLAKASPVAAGHNSANAAPR